MIKNLINFIVLLRNYIYLTMKTNDKEKRFLLEERKKQIIFRLKYLRREILKSRFLFLIKNEKIV